MEPLLLPQNAISLQDTRAEQLAVTIVQLKKTMDAVGKALSQAFDSFVKGVGHIMRSIKRWLADRHIRNKPLFTSHKPRLTRALSVMQHKYRTSQKLTS